MTAKLLAKLSALWADKRPGLEDVMRPGATRTALARFERAIGLPLPPAFRALYAWHDGAEDDDLWLEGSYGFMRLDHVRSHKQMLDLVRGDDGTWNRSWIPFLQENSSDVVCVGTRTGKVFEWFNSSRKPRLLLAPSLDAWLAQHLAIREAAASLADNDAVYAAFNGGRAIGVRKRIAPGYPRRARLAQPGR